MIPMGMKLSEFNGQPAIYVLWRTREPQKGDYMTMYNKPEGEPYAQAIGRKIFEKRLYSTQHPRDANMTEDWWSFTEMSELEFQRMRRATSHSERMSETHDSLF
jgi:hypothetical protein